MAYDPASDVIEDEEEIDLESQSKDQEKTGSETEKAVEELLFAVGEGAEQKKLAFKQLTPDHVKPWYEAHTNMKSWQATNTQNAQKLAKEREDFEKKQKEHGYSLDQLKLWEDYFSKNQELQGLVTAYLQGKISKEALTQLIGAKVAEQPAGQVNPEIQRRIDALEARLQKTDELSKAEQDARARKEAFALLKSQHPELKEEDFSKFLDDETGKIDDLPALYTLAHDAYRWRNRGDMEKKAEEDALKKLQAQRGAAVETGSTQSAVSLPKNVDTTKSMDEIFDEFERSLGT
jgi:hypothetical protein